MSREFSFNRGLSNSNDRKGDSLKSIKEELSKIDPEDVVAKVRHFLDEVSYSCKHSIDEKDKHEHIQHLDAACRNVASLLACFPVMMRDNKVEGVLKNPEILAHIPNIDVRNLNVHASVILHAAKIYLGVSDEKMSSSDIARQFFALIGQLISPNTEKGVLDSTAKMFARQVNDSLHILTAKEQPKADTTASGSDEDDTIGILQNN